MLRIMEMAQFHGGGGGGGSETYIPFQPLTVKGALKGCRAGELQFSASTLNL